MRRKKQVNTYIVKAGGHTFKADGYDYGDVARRVQIEIGLVPGREILVALEDNPVDKWKQFVVTTTTRYIGEVE